MRDVANKLDHIIGKVAKKYCNTSHKFRIIVPKTVDAALYIYKEMGTNLC